MKIYLNFKIDDYVHDESFFKKKRDFSTVNRKIGLEGC